MAFKSDKPEISYSQVAELALSLSTKDQLKLAEDLQRAGLKAKWDEILAAFRIPYRTHYLEIARHFDLSCWNNVSTWCFNSFKSSC